MYCSDCPKEVRCHQMCGMYKQYLDILAECLGGCGMGNDPCQDCARKADFDCPLFGCEKDNFKRYYLGDDDSL